MQDSIIKKVDMSKFWHDLGVASDKALLKAITEAMGEDGDRVQPSEFPATPYTHTS